VTNYASKDLIDRSVAYMEWILKNDRNPTESGFEIIRSLTKATPLPASYMHGCVLDGVQATQVDDVIHLKPNKEPRASIPYTPCPYTAVIPTETQEHPMFRAIMNAIGGWDIRRLPGDGLAGATGTDVALILNALAEVSELEPEPRASSALLEAARTVWMTSPAFAKTGPECDHLSAVNDLYVAVKAEEARGPSEVEEMREEIEEAIQHLNRWKPTCDLVDGVTELVGEYKDAVARADLAEAEIRELRKELALVTAERDEADHGLLVLRPERNEAVARAEKAEADVNTIQETLDMRSDRADEVEADLRSLRTLQDEAKRTLRLEAPVSEWVGIVEACSVAVDVIRELRKDVAATEERAEIAEEAVAEMQSNGAERWDEKLRAFADWIRETGDCTEEQALAKIDALLANPPGKGAGVHKDTDSLAAVLCLASGDFQYTDVDHEVIVDALAELCRRALGGK